MYGKEGHKEAFVMTEEEMLIGELARLQTIMMMFEDKEEYEKAAITLMKIDMNIKKLIKIKRVRQGIG
jgi:hypothetical protein